MLAAARLGTLEQLDGALLGVHATHVRRAFDAEVVLAVVQAVELTAKLFVEAYQACLRRLAERFDLLQVVVSEKGHKENRCV